MKHQVIAGAIDAHVMAQLYQVADQRHLPAEARGESTGLRYYAKARHRLDEPVQPVDRAKDAEVLGLLRACRSARDRNGEVLRDDPFRLFRGDRLVTSGRQDEGAGRLARSREVRHLSCL